MIVTIVPIASVDSSKKLSDMSFCFKSKLEKKLM